MLYLKACSKCSGDLTLEEDSYGTFLKCPQCGKFAEVTEVNETSPYWMARPPTRSLSRRQRERKPKSRLPP